MSEEVALAEYDAVVGRLVDVLSGRVSDEAAREKLWEATRVIFADVFDFAEFTARELAVGLFVFFSIYRVMLERGVMVEAENISNASATIMAI